MISSIEGAKKNIRIIMPYVTKIDAMEKALEEAAERRVKVEIITARKRDQPVYKDFLNSDLFGDLMKKGVKVYEEPYKYLHMKAYQIDDSYFSIGSFNQDVTSFYCNNEANIVIKTDPTKDPSTQMNESMPHFTNMFK